MPNFIPPSPGDNIFAFKDKGTAETLARMAEERKLRPNQSSKARLETPPTLHNIDRSVVLIKNIADVAPGVRYAPGMVLQLGNVIDRNPDINADTFYPGRRWLFEADVVDDPETEKYVILLEPLGKDEIGLGQVDGVCKAIFSPSPTAGIRYATPRTGSLYLESVTSGPIEILSQDLTGPDEHGHRIVRLNVPTATALAAQGVASAVVGGSPISVSGVTQTLTSLSGLLSDITGTGFALRADSKGIDVPTDGLYLAFFTCRCWGDKPGEIMYFYTKKVPGGAGSTDTIATAHRGQPNPEPATRVTRENVASTGFSRMLAGDSIEVRVASSSGSAHSISWDEGQLRLLRVAN